MRRLAVVVILLLIASFATTALVAPKTKNRILIRSADAVERLLRPIEFKAAYQPFFKRVLLLAQRGLGSGRDDMGSSGEAVALLAYRDRVLATRPDRIVLFDIGAFEGEYTDVLLSAFAADAPVEIHAFEPAPQAFGALSARLGSTPHLHLVNAALGEAAATLALHVDPSPKMNSLVERPHLKGTLATIDVPVITLDEYCAQNAISHVDILKLDVEGYEMNVLKGAKTFLARRAIRIIQFEYGGFALANKVMFHDLFALLGGDFDIFRIVGDGFEPIPPGSGVWEQNGIGGNYAAFLKPAPSTGS